MDIKRTDKQTLWLYDWPGPEGQFTENEGQTPKSLEIPEKVLKKSFEKVLRKCFGNICVLATFEVWQNLSFGNIYALAQFAFLWYLCFGNICVLQHMRFSNICALVIIAVCQHLRFQTFPFCRHLQKSWVSPVKGERQFSEKILKKSTEKVMGKSWKSPEQCWKTIFCHSWKSED